MNKTELITTIAAKVEINKKDVANTLEATLEAITEELASKGTISLIGFGTFTTSQRAAREGINPSTGEKIQIPATTVPKFKAGKKLKDSVKK